MKRVIFLGDSRTRIREFPESARREAGIQLGRVQIGLDPFDWKPMKSIGTGVREIRVRDAAGAFGWFMLRPVQRLSLSFTRFKRRVRRQTDGI